MQHCAGFIPAVTLHVSGANAHHQEYLKLVQRPLVHVLSLQVSHISLLGPFGPNKEMWWLTCNDNTCTSGRCTSFKYSWWWTFAPETCRVTAEIKPAQCCIKLVFHLTYTMMHGSTKLKCNLKITSIYLSQRITTLSGGGGWKHVAESADLVFA